MNQNLPTKKEEVTEQKLVEYLNALGLNKRLTGDETLLFIEICKNFNLNPFKREVHVNKYGNQMTLVTGYEVYLKRAEATGLLDGWKAWTEGDKETLKGCVEIHRKDRKHPFYWEAYFSEFKKMNSQGKTTQFWQMSHFMIKKVAISQAFRLCFPLELGGMPYTADELPDEKIERHEEKPKEPIIHPLKSADAPKIDENKVNKVIRAFYKYNITKNQIEEYFVKNINELNDKDWLELKDIYGKLREGQDPKKFFRSYE